MQIHQVSVNELSHDPANARTHSKRNIESIVASLRRFGQQKPIVCDSSNVVRAGNGTLEAARELGWNSVAVVYTDLKGSDAIAYAIADNRVAELAEWDEDVLAAQLHGLDEELQTVSGFDKDEMDKLFKNLDDINFAPGTEEEQGKLDEFDPKMITCPGCGTEFDARAQM